MIKFGILGLGRVVKSRIFDVFKKEVKKASVIAVYDKDKSKNFKFSKYFKIKTSKSLKDFLKKKFDYVYIATESGSHAKRIKSCLDQGKNVIVEKPPTLRIDHLMKLEKFARKKKLDFFVVFQNNKLFPRGRAFRVPAYPSGSDDSTIFRSHVEPYDSIGPEIIY